MKTDREMASDLHAAAYRIVKLQKLIDEERMAIRNDYLHHLDKRSTPFDGELVNAMERALNDEAMSGPVNAESFRIILSAHRHRLANNLMLGKDGTDKILAGLVEVETWTTDRA